MRQTSRLFGKHILLIGLALVGFLYAVPNLYREAPAIQISSAKPSPQLLTDVQAILAKAKLPYEAISSTSQGAEIRFSSTDTQLLAQDTIKAGLGTQYTVALNLIPATPRWLQRIGATPMKQGLDLRGGVHLLLEVDVNSVVRRRYEGLVKNVVDDLRTHRIRYATFRDRREKGIEFVFRSPEDAHTAYTLLEADNPAVQWQIDASTVTGLLTPAEMNHIRQDTIEQTMSILRNRVNELGVGEAVVQQQGATRVAVDLPGLQDAARAKQILGGTATLQFYLVDESHDADIAKQTGAVPVSSKLYMLEERPILLKRQVVLNGEAITSATSNFDSQSASHAVQIQLGGGGERLFTTVTRDNIGHRMAIVFVESKTVITPTATGSERTTRREERVISAPVIQSALGNNFQITGLRDSQEAANLALLLRAGALPAVIYPVEERTVGPSLGKENIHRGLISLVVGMSLILVVMVFYYHLFGLIANIGLFLNLILLAAILSLIGATLTLPGIAAFVLTVGMAVDANVLIYERIREELRRGVSPLMAIQAGYDRAFSTIMDANVTTLIVGIVLFAIGTGPIRGFAIILSIGLLTSMLTSVTYTRAIVDLCHSGRQLKKLSIGI